MNNVNRKKGLYIFGLLFSVFVVFFVGRLTDKETGASYFSFMSNGITSFRKGLDVSGGVKMTYKIDFSDYKQIYQDPFEFASVKKRTQDIVVNNINNRISTLGVSDYNVSVNNMNGEDYLVIEIGGVQDMNYAKSLIGKTVQLEFKTLNEATPTEGDKQKRKAVAEALYKQVSSNSANFSDIVDGKASDDIYYNKIENLTLSQLPELYTKNGFSLDGLSSGKIYPSIMEGVYASFTGANQDGSENLTVLTGFLIVKYLGSQERAIDRIDSTLFSQKISSLGLTSTEELKKNFSGNANVPEYDAKNQQLNFYQGEIAPGEEAYNVSVYKLPKQSLLGKSQADGEKLVNDLRVQTQALKSALENGQNPSVSVSVEGRKTIAEITSIIPNFKNSSNTKVLSFEEFDANYIVLIKDQKNKSDRLSRVSVVQNVSPQKYTQFNDSLKSERTYSFEEIFVRDRVNRIVAKDPKSSEILNGAFFKFAQIDSSQVGKPIVSISFNDKGKEIFCNITESNIDKQLAIFVGGNLLTAPYIRAKICGGDAQIDGNFDIQSAKKLTTDLNEGAMPVKLILSNEEKVSPTLGEDTISASLIAGAVGLILIAAMLLIMYGPMKMAIGMMTMAVFVIVLLAFVKVIDYAMSMSGIAAILLTLGMAVDANILIFERYNEERASGKSHKDSLDIAVNRSRAPIVDGNVSTFLIALVLFVVGTNIFKGFGLMMMLNAVMIIFINVPVTKYLMQMFLSDKKN